MRALSASELLGVWDRGLNQGWVQRGLELLAASSLETSPETLAGLSIGQRDAMLLTLRELTFGPQMAGVIVCRHCAERLELTFTTADVRAQPAVDPAPALSLDIAGHHLCLRSVNSLDLIAAAQVDSARSRRLLFDRCVLAASHEGAPRSADRLPTEVVEAAVGKMAEADPQADVHLAISCPFCGYHQQAPFDIVSFFWTEIEAWACRILREVHVLASAYGWHEGDILTLSPTRRQFYLEMVGA